MQRLQHSQERYPTQIRMLHLVVHQNESGVSKTLLQEQGHPGMTRSGHVCMRIYKRQHPDFAFDCMRRLQSWQVDCCGTAHCALSCVNGLLFRLVAGTPEEDIKMHVLCSCHVPFTIATVLHASHRRALCSCVIRCSDAALSTVCDSCLLGYRPEPCVSSSLPFTTQWDQISNMLW